jgi:hypothetical protein
VREALATSGIFRDAVHQQFVGLLLKDLDGSMKEVLDDEKVLWTIPPRQLL